MELITLAFGWINLIILFAGVIWIYQRKFKSNLQMAMGARKRELFELQLTSSYLEDVVRSSVIDLKLQEHQQVVLLSKLNFWQKAFDEACLQDQLELNRIQAKIDHANIIKRANITSDFYDHELARQVLAELKLELQHKYSSTQMTSIYLNQACNKYSKGVI